MGQHAPSKGSFYDTILFPTETCSAPCLFNFYAEYIMRSAGLEAQGNRLSCRDQEGRRGSEEAVPGPSVIPSREPCVSGDFWAPSGRGPRGWGCPRQVGAPVPRGRKSTECCTGPERPVPTGSAPSGRHSSTQVRLDRAGEANVCPEAGRGVPGLQR